jgi:hypothetical protein
VSGDETAGGPWGGRPWHSDPTARLGGETEFHGPRIGDTVEVAVRGRVTGMVARDGVPGVTVEVAGSFADVWRPLDEAVIVARRQQ